MVILPEIRGTLTIRSEPEQFFRGFRRRVKSGLLTGTPHRRSNYIATQVDPQHLFVRAADWKSAVNVGLNDLDLEWAGKATLRYRVRYWRWTLFCLVLGAALGAVGMSLVLTFDVHGYMLQTPGLTLWGLTVEQNMTLLWAFLIFWGFVWPWMLVVLHQRPLHALVARLVSAVDESADVSS